LLQGTYVRHASYVVALHTIPDPSGNSEAGSELKIPREGL